MTERPRTTSQLPPSDALVPESRRLGRYEIVYRVARGGMATVYLARLSASLGFTKWVAIKTIHAHVADEERYVGMFLDEARLAARIDHPNVCTVFDFGESDGTYFIAMEYLHGLALSSVLKRASLQGGVPPGVGARIIADAARGLHAAHELRGPDGRQAGVVHRDCSPQNVFVLYDGIAKMVDFGIAKSNDQLGERTRTTELKGKIAYMAPEQVNQSLLDRRADLWALGVVLWETTLSRRLFQRANDMATLNAVVYEEVPRPSMVDPAYPPALEAIVMRALSRDPAQRYQTAAEMARDLEVFLANLPEPVTNTEVGAFMQKHFHADIAARNEALRVYERSAAQSVPTSASRAAGSSPRTVPPPPPSLPPKSEATQPFASLLAVPPSPQVPAASTLITLDPRAPAFDMSALPPPVQPRNEGSGWLFAVVAIGVLGFGGYLAYNALRAPSRGAEMSATDGASVSSATDARVTPIVASAADASTATIVAPALVPGAGTAIPVWHAPVSAGPTGGLEIVSTIAVRVYERERVLGETPLVQRALPVGDHTLRLMPLDGRASRTVTVSIREGRTTARRERW